MRTELRLVVGFENTPQHFLQQFVRPCWDTQRSLLRRALFVDADPFCGRPPIPLEAEAVDDFRDLLLRHPVGGLPSRSRGQRATIARDLSVGVAVEVGVVQLPVHVIQWQSSSPPFTNDRKDLFGASHLAYLPFPCHRITCLPSPCDGLSRRGLLWSRVAGPHCCGPAP